MGELPQPPLSAVDDLVVLPGGDVLFEIQSSTKPPAWYRRRHGGGPAVRTALAETSPADYSDCEVVRESAVSRDGTRVPITVLRHGGMVLDGTHPTILYGHGGCGVCQTPTFRARLRAWIDRGGVFAVAHVRGGGEFGERWHREGCLELKQNVFDDFAACARRMVSLGYATPMRCARCCGSVTKPRSFRAASSARLSTCASVSAGIRRYSARGSYDWGARWTICRAWIRRQSHFPTTLGARFTKRKRRHRCLRFQPLPGCSIFGIDWHPHAPGFYWPGRAVPPFTIMSS